MAFPFYIYANGVLPADAVRTPPAPLKPYFMLSPRHFWPQDGILRPDPDPEIAAAWGAKAKAAGAPLVFDWEENGPDVPMAYHPWFAPARDKVETVDGKIKVTQAGWIDSMNRLTPLLRAAKSTIGTGKLIVYDHFPMGNTWGWPSCNTADAMQAELICDAALRQHPNAGLVTALMPGFYPTGMDGWWDIQMGCFCRTMKRARSYGKSIIPILSPVFIGGPNDGKALMLVQWRSLVGLVKTQGATGAAVWRHPHIPDEYAKDEWFATLGEFL